MVATSPAHAPPVLSATIVFVSAVVALLATYTPPPDAASLPATVTSFLERRRPANATLSAALAAYVAERTGEVIPARKFDVVDLPAHLRINVRVVDAAGVELAMDRDLAPLRDRLHEAARMSFAAEGPAFERKGLRAWTFGELPETLAVSGDGGHGRRSGADTAPVTGYPALVDEGDDGVALSLLDTKATAEAATRKGVVRLIGFELGDALARMVRHAPAWTGIGLALRASVPLDRLQDDVRAAVADRAFMGEDPLPRDRDAFLAQVKRARTRLPAVFEGALHTLAAIASEYQALSQKLAAMPPAQRMLASEARQQRDALVYAGFMAATPWEQLQHLPRYLQALARRIDRQPQNPERDARHARQIAQWWTHYRERADAAMRTGPLPPRLAAFRWLIEELRVSLFAQELRTPIPVSQKRVEKAWAELSRLE